MLLQVYPEKGTVSFSAGLHGWAFTLTSFAKIYASKFGVEVPHATPQLPGACLPSIASCMGAQGPNPGASKHMELSTQRSTSEFLPVGKCCCLLQSALWRLPWWPVLGQTPQSHVVDLCRRRR